MTAAAYAKSIEVLEQLLVIKPDDATARNSLARSYGVMRSLFRNHGLREDAR